jgi:flavodoxin
MQGILYFSTTSGNTRLVGEALQGIFANAGITLTLQDVAEDTTWQQDEVDFVLFGSGTYAHGMIEKSLRKCVEEIWKEKKIRIPCAAIGLGDHRYDVEYNMYAADQLESWITEHGGNLLCPALKINRSPIKPNNQKIIENWAKNFITTLRK